MHAKDKKKIAINEDKGPMQVKPLKQTFDWVIEINVLYTNVEMQWK